MLMALGFFSCLLLGIFIGRNTGRTALTVETVQAPPQTEITAPATQPDPFGEKLNINTATLEQLARLPGIGEVIAGRIVEFRRENGPFQSIEELTDVEGIGEKRMDELREYITVR